MTVKDIAAVDVHGHYGAYYGEANPIEEFMSAGASEVVRRANAANIELTIVSPLKALLPRGRGKVVSGNIDAAHRMAQFPELLQYVVVHPGEPHTFDQADEMLRHPRCVGIKIHPEEHCYPIRDFGRLIFEFAAQRTAIVLTHTSEQNSLATDFVQYGNDYPEVRIILAHIGCGWDGDKTHQVRAVQASLHGNIYADTSSAKSVTSGLIEWAVREIGADRVLFGTDTPLYHAASQRARIDHADLTDHEKQLVLRQNAVRLFCLDTLVRRQTASQLPTNTFVQESSGVSSKMNIP